MNSLTYRELKMWDQYFEEEYNHPSRTDFYLMQIAREVVKAPLKKEQKKKVKTNHFLIKFVREKKKREPVTKKQAAQASKAKWFGLTGFRKQKNG